MGLTAEILSSSGLFLFPQVFSVPLLQGPPVNNQPSPFNHTYLYWIYLWLIRGEVTSIPFSYRESTTELWKTSATGTVRNFLVENWLLSTRILPNTSWPCSGHEQCRLQNHSVCTKSFGFGSSGAPCHVSFNTWEGILDLLAQM